MSDLIRTAEARIEGLQAALMQTDGAKIDRAVLSLERDLIDNEAYRAIGDERLLATAYYLLLQRYGDKPRLELQGLYQHLELIRAIHDRFFAILDYDVELDLLLYEHLAHWPLVDRPVRCLFDEPARDELRRTRSTGNTEQRLENFMATFFQCLRNQGLTDVADTLHNPSELALEGYKRSRLTSAYGLFTAAGKGQVYGIKIRAEGNGEGRIKCLGSIGPEMQKAADRALECIKGLRPQVQRWNFTWEIGRDDIAFEGNSVGLALTAAIISKVDGLEIDAYTAFTGHVHWENGQVTGIDLIDAKLRGAKRLGVRRAFIPTENYDAALNTLGIKVIAVGSVQEIHRWLQNQTFQEANTEPKKLAQIKIVALETDLEVKHIRAVKHEEGEEQRRITVTFSDYREEVPVMVHYGQRGLRYDVGGKETALKGLVQEACERVFGTAIDVKEERAGLPQRQYAKYQICEPAMQHIIEQHIFARGDAIRESQKDCTYRAKVVKSNQTAFVRQFSNGKLTVDGFNPLFNEIDGGIRAVLGVSDSPQNSNSGDPTRLEEQIQAVQAADLGDQWIGTDEAGKGDYFGPLVSAAVFVDDRIARLLEGLGVRDSKSLSDKRNRELAAQISQICGKRAQVVTIPPVRYNQLYEQFRSEGKNLNWLLAWAHTRALENVLEKFPSEHISVLVDKFGDQKYVQSKLLAESRRANLNIVQLPKAEANVAVAVASIMARAQFLQSLEELSRNYGVELPKGASDPRIIEVAKQIVSRRSQAELSKVAKLHFKTTQNILGH